MILFFGFDPITLFRNIKGMVWYLRDFFKLKKQLDNNTFKISVFYPVLLDKSDTAGVLSGHYFHQDLLVAQKLHINNPIRHVDVGSRIDGFVAHVASYRPIEVIDIRPLKSNVSNISFLQVDFMQSLKDEYIEYTDSVSCLHAIEHFGLGRYGDPIDSDGHLKGYKNLCMILKPKGKLYFSTPIGKQRIEFNAHRVFSIAYLMDLFKKDFILDDFYFVDDKKNLKHPSNINNSEDINNNFGCHYGCGIFFLTKCDY